VQEPASAATEGADEPARILMSPAGGPSWAALALKLLKLQSPERGLPRPRGKQRAPSLPGPGAPGGGKCAAHLLPQLLPECVRGNIHEAVDAGCDGALVGQVPAAAAGAQGGHACQAPWMLPWTPPDLSGAARGAGSCC
jgi:hypothetical protein